MFHKKEQPFYVMPEHNDYTNKNCEHNMHFQRCMFQYYCLQSKRTTPWFKYCIAIWPNHTKKIGMTPVQSMQLLQEKLTLWGRVTHICVGNLTISGSDNGLAPNRRQAIIWTNAGILLIGPLRTAFSDILIKVHTYSFKKMHLKTSSAKWRPFCFGLIVLTAY